MRLIEWTDPASVLRHVHELERAGQGSDDSENWKRWAQAKIENPDGLLEGLFWRYSPAHRWHLLKHCGRSRDSNDLLVPSLTTACRAYWRILLEGFAINPNDFQIGVNSTNRQLCQKCVDLTQGPIDPPRDLELISSLIASSRPILYSDPVAWELAEPVLIATRLTVPMTLAVALHPYDFELIKNATALSLLRLSDVVDPRFIQRILTIEPDNCSAPIVAEYQQQQPDREVTRT